MMRLLLSASFFALAATSAAAQNVIWHDGFENGFAGWTEVNPYLPGVPSDTFWHPEPATAQCGSQVAPFPEGQQVAYYGQFAFGFCNYAIPGGEFGPEANGGTLTNNEWIDLPPSTGSITLRYWSWSASEHCSGFDLHWVEILAQNGPDAGFVAEYCAPGSAQHQPWHERRVDISAYAGARVRVRFGFDSVDGYENYDRGWFVDDVSIVVEPGTRVCPDTGLSSGCPCMPSFVPVAGGCRNSTTQSAVMFSAGVPRVSADTLSFRAVHMPPSASAILSQSTDSAPTTSFGDGLRCVSGATRRLGVAVASGGVAEWPAPGAPSISTLGLVPAGGATRYYYVFYRDALSYCTPAAFNLTDTQRIVWSP